MSDPDPIEVNVTVRCHWWGIQVTSNQPWLTHRFYWWSPTMLRAAFQEIRRRMKR